MQALQAMAPAALPSGAVLFAIEGYIRAELGKRLGAFLDRAEQTLDESWRASSNPADWSAGREAADWLARHKQAIQDAMYTRMVQSLNGVAAPRAADLAELRLMDVEELSVTLARARMVSRVMESGKAEVCELEARLQTLAAARIRVNPKGLSPGQLVDCFQGILQEYGVPPKAQSVLMGAFGERSAAQIIEFYDGLNALLHREGITTTFTGVNTPRLSAPHAPAAASPLPDWQPGQLRALLQQQWPLIRSGDAGQAPSPAQLRRMDHIEAFLLDILRDTRISERIRGEFNRLALPLMVAQLTDPQIFQGPDSPVRVFVRQLALLGYRDQETPLPDFELIQALVSRIVAEGGQEADSFHGAAEALYTLARRQVRRLKEAKSGAGAGPAAEGDDGRQLTLAEEARRQVLLELREHAAGMVLPQPVQVFILRLLGPWMMVRYQRYGEGSQPWAEARAFAALFFDSLRPAVDEKEQVRKRALRRRTLQEARIRTERSRAPAEPTRALLDWLASHFAELDQRLYQPADGTQQLTNLAFLEALPVLPES
jgi:hypothetical protein